MDNAQALCDLLAVHEDDGGEDGSLVYLLSLLSFTFLDKGCWKRVYHSPLFPDIVLKHAIEVTGEGAEEVKNYECAPAHIRPLLLPILSHSRRLQVQAFVEFHICPRTCRGFVPGMSDSGNTNHTHDKDGNLIIVDYGQTGEWNTRKII
jgi:hypothetical protein